MKILLFCDSHWRDLPTCALIKKKILEQDNKANVIIVPYLFHDDVVLNFKPDVVVLSHTNGNRNRNLINLAKRFDAKIVILPTEGRPDRLKDVDWVSNTNGADLYLSWSDNLAKIIASKSNIETKVTGCPRFEIVTKYQSAIKQKEILTEEYGINLDKPIVAFAAGYPQSKFNFFNIEFNRQDRSDLGDYLSGRERAKQEWERWQKFQSGIVNTVLEYGNKFEYIFKPHPMDDVLSMQRFCNDYGIKCVRGDYIFNFVSVADVLIAKVACLTHQDAWLMRKPTIHLLADDLSYWDGATEESLKYGNSIATNLELPEHIQYALFDEEEKDATPYLEKYGFLEENSSDKVASAILALGKQNNLKADFVTLQHIINKIDNAAANLIYDNLGHFQKNIMQKELKMFMEML